MSKIIVYLDNCCFNRPYDDQEHLSIYLETQAKLAIQELVKDNEISLIWSFILDYENQANPDKIVKNEIFSWRNIADKIIVNNHNILEKAKEFVMSGLGKKDALHLSSALNAECDYFITVDKGILRKIKKLDKIVVCSPIEFIDFLEEEK